MSGGDYGGLARLRDDMGLPWGVVSEDGRIIEDPELACSRATHANIVVVSPDTVQAALTSGRVVDHSAASAQGVVNHKKTLSRGTCVLCGQYAVLGSWCAAREDFLCCACHDRYDDDDDEGVKCPEDGTPAAVRLGPSSVFHGGHESRLNKPSLLLSAQATTSTMRRPRRPLPSSLPSQLPSHPPRL